MIQTLKKRLYDRFKESRIDKDNIVSIVCIVLAISVIAVPAVAQVDTFSDDFEDGNANGWEDINDETPPVVTVTPTQDSTYSMYVDGGTPETQYAVWNSGPTLDLNEEFTVKATLRFNQGTENERTRVGIFDDPESGNGAMIVFSGEFGETYLAPDFAASPTADAYQTDFDSTWVNIEMYSAGNSTVYAKVWEVGTTEPAGYELNRSFTPTEGKFNIQTSVTSDTDDTREGWLDNVSVTGTTETDPTLRLDTGNYLEFGGTQDYTVYDLQGENQIRNDVTENSSVTSGNTSVITVNENTNELTATTNENVSTRVNITATYNGRTDIQQVTVASPTIDNLDVLPFMWRISAMFLDRGFQMILVGLLLAIAATRIGGVFAGLGIYQMGLTAGWLIGWVPIGLAMVGLFSTLFIGLNIAANIDYSVRR